MPTVRRGVDALGLTPVISYARISSDGEGDGHGVGNQHAENGRTAQRHGWQVVCELTDNDRSASKPDVYREDFEKLIRALVAGKCPCHGHEIQGVVTVHQDRMARKFGDWERFTDALTSEPGRVYCQEGSVKDPYSEGFVWEGVAGMVGAKQEPKKISKRTKRSHRDRAQAGQPVGGTRPFGWLPDRISLDPAEAEYARTAIQHFVAGKSINSITAWLQSEDVRTPSGKLWTNDALRKFLNNPRMCGWRRLNGEIVRDHGGKEVVGVWEPLVTVDEWLACAARNSARKDRQVRPDGSLGGVISPEQYARKYLLTGFLRCGNTKRDGNICLTRMRCGPYSNKGGKKRLEGHVYSCMARQMGGCAGCSRNGERLDRFVTEAVLTKLEMYAHEAPAVEPWPREDEWENTLEARAQLTKAWDNGNGSIPSDTFFTLLLPDIERKLTELRTDRERHAAAFARDSTLPTNVREEWAANDDLAWRRAMIARALNTVIVLPVGSRWHSWDETSVRLIWKTQ